MNRYQIVERGVETFHAGRKAPRDVMTVLDGCGFQRVTVRREPQGGLGRVGYLFTWLWRCLAFCRGIPRSSIVFSQYPSQFVQGHVGRYLLWCARFFKRAHIITLIHDIDTLRESDSTQDVPVGAELRDVLKWSDAIIVHNETMRDWLAARGIPLRKMTVLRLFDYLADGSVSGRDRPRGTRTVAIAGNLDPAKSGYLRDLRELSMVRWYLYGPNFDQESITGGTVTYQGCFPPEELPGFLRADYGLVWDGDSIDTCLGGMGEYLRVNSPHKVSLYLASGLPVIVWKESALARMVVDEGLGITVESLREIPDRLGKVDDTRYRGMCLRVAAYGERLRRGKFIKEAVEKACSNF